MENTGLASALPIQIGASIGFGLAQDWLIGPNWHALAPPQRGMPIHVNPVQSANPRPIQNTAETVRPPDWHGLADWIFKKGEYFTRPIVQQPTFVIFLAVQDSSIGDLVTHSLTE